MQDDYFECPSFYLADNNVNEILLDSENFIKLT